ncbi:uncharacterized protein LOC143359062 [Halictus rubicundus]|uniref:uncharacterized protein LOC143359062 n=1 Tax=Halictus rubicundus TaxID=77578 RepID=UPI0040374ACE
MEDQELIELRNLKAKLLESTNVLTEKLKNYEGNDRKCLSFDKLASDITKDIIITENPVDKHKKRKFCKVTRQVTGIKFQNIVRKWMNDDIFKYTADIVTSDLNFIIELAVKIEGDNEFEIQNITCHFIGFHDCYMLEIKSWIQDISKKKNFSLLVSAFSHYSEKYKIRKNILDQLQEKKYATWEPCVEKDGGIMVFIQSPQNIKEHHVYLQFQWSLIFLEKFWQSEHFFDIQPTPEGEDFAKENHDLLRNFCKKCITTKELIGLWHKICNAIDLYENKNENDLHEDTQG